MNNSKLIFLLKSYDAEDWRLFAKFISSPFYNQKEEIVRFFDILRTLAPEFPAKKMEKEKIMQKLFPKKEFDIKIYKYLTNLLLKLGEEFIAIKEMKNRELIQDYHLLNAYVKRGVDKNYQFILKKVLKQQETLSQRDADFYYRNYLLKNVQASHFSNQTIRKNNEATEQLMTAFDIYYFSTKLKHTCHLMSNQSVISLEFENQLTNEIIEQLNQGLFSDIPAIRLYHQLYLLLTEGNKDDFLVFKDLFFELENYFSNTELRDLYIIIINYCIRQLEKAKETQFFLQELYDLYIKAIDKELILTDGYLSPWTYKNVTKLGLRLQKYKETEDFISQNKNRLKIEFQSDAFHYAMAELFYYQKNYDETLSYLLQVDYSDVYYILDTKSLMLKIYYETDEEEAMLSLMASFQTYLRRNSLISENVKNTYLNFVRCLNRVIKEKHSEKLLEEIKSYSPLYDKNWLLSKVKKR